MARHSLDFALTPVQKAFVESDAVINAIISNTGEGKTYASIVALLYHAKRCGRPINVAIVRDTHENIKTSTVRSFFEVFADHPALLRFRNDFKQLTIHTNPRVEVDLFGIDDLASLSKLQGPEYALIWLEEPAPISDKANAGLSEEVYNAAMVRCARQKGARARLQISMNPADEDHWTYRRLIEEPDALPEFPLITKRVFTAPYGSNPHVSETSRQAVMAAYKDDAASYMRYVEGRFAPVYRGVKVTPEFKPETHVSAAPLIPAPGLESFRAWDGWHNPVCLLGQVSKTGRVICIDMVRLIGGDVRVLMETQVLPLMNAPRWKGKAKAWRDIGDISMEQPDQSNVEESAAKTIERTLGGVFEGGPKRWEHMRASITRSLNMMIAGSPAVVINPELRMLVKGLAGGWHYKTDSSGNVIATVPVKNEVSHICDAWANAVAVLLPVIDLKDYRDMVRRQGLRNRQLAASYAGSSVYAHG